MTAIFFAIDQLPPYRRMFSVQDKTIMFPYAVHEHVPVWLLLVSYSLSRQKGEILPLEQFLTQSYHFTSQILCFIIPFAAISAYSILVRRSVRDFHNGILGKVELTLFVFGY
jgi:diacylglycerol diphosphate phosphatase/phosphatidate phosphatase